MKNFEDKLQEACVTWFRYQYPEVVIFAIPNGGSRNPIEAAKLKRTGTLAGVADLFIVKDKVADEPWDSFYHGFFIEIKVGKNIQTISQEAFQINVTRAGYKYEVVRSLDEFINVVNNYML